MIDKIKSKKYQHDYYIRTHKQGNCKICKNLISFHNQSGFCASCSCKKRLKNPKNNPNYKNGKSYNNRCKCGNKISFYAKLCRKCFSKINGKKHHNWKGGTTELKDLIRNNTTYKIWRKAIFQRGNYTCQICKKHKSILNVDHYPIPFNKILKQYVIKTLNQALKCNNLWDLKIGRTLCLKCHKKTATYIRG